MVKNNMTGTNYTHLTQNQNTMAPAVLLEYTYIVSPLKNKMLITTKKHNKWNFTPNAIPKEFKTHNLFIYFYIYNNYSSLSILLELLGRSATHLH